MRIDRYVFYKVPGVTPSQLNELHQLLDGKDPEIEGTELISSKLDEEKKTYTIELKIPINVTSGKISLQIKKKVPAIVLARINYALQIFQG